MENFFNLDDDFENIIKQHLENVISIEKIPTGWTNYVFKAETKNNAYVFRFPRNAFFADAMKKEAGFARFVGSRIKNPKSVKLILKEDEGRFFSVHKFIKGRTLTEGYEALTEKQKKQAAKDLTKYIYKLQRLNFSKLDMSLLSTFLTNLAAVNGNENYNFSHIQKLTEQENKRLVLVHGDLNPGNVILSNKGRVTAILDYAFFSVSSPYADASRLCGRLPEEFTVFMIDEMIKRKLGDENIKSVKELVVLWNYVEEDYVDYMKKQHPDVEISFLN